jgi:hypothetical protein
MIVSKLLALHIVPVIVVLLVAIPFAQQQNAHAQNLTVSCTGVESCYEQGYAQGKANPGTSCTETQKEIQTDNYINYCAGYSDGSGITTVTPSTGGGNTGTNWMDLCTKISFALTSSCDTLVNPDNTLTSQGMHVRDCIQGGTLLAGAALLLGTPPTTIVSVLPTVAQLGGCGDVVDFSKLNLGQLQGLGSIFR